MTIDLYALVALLAGAEVVEDPTPPPARPLCRNCNRNVATQARGLCGACYRTRRVRERFARKYRWAPSARDTRPWCRNCGVRKANRARGLCWSCYHSPGVRERFPSTSKFAVLGAGHGCTGYALPSAPTPHAPGSPGKVAVLCQRFAEGVALWHPADAPMDPESRALGVA